MIGVRLAVRLLGLGFSLLRYATGRRLLAALILAAACGGPIGLLFAAPEPADAWTDQRAEADTTPTHPAVTPKPRPTPKPAQTTKHPDTQEPRTAEQAARAWYARRHHLPVDRVRILQADQTGERRVRVLVMTERDGGRLDTAVVSVTRDGTRWQVRP